MTRRFNERQGPFGGKYWEDDEGNKIQDRQGPFGGRYAEDADGKKVQQRIGPLGNTYWEDDKGNKVQELTGPFGGKYQVDSDGNKSELRTGPFGGRSLEGDSNTPIFSEESTTSQSSSAVRGFSMPRVRSSSIADDGPAQLIGILLGLGLALVALFFFVYFGLPILAGVWGAKLVNRRWVQPVPERQRWRWAILPAVFVAGALPTNELVAAGFGAVSCADPQSVSCANYRLNPAPTVLGLHRWLMQRDLLSNSSQQSSNSAWENQSRVGSQSAAPAPDVVASTPAHIGMPIDRWQALQLIESWLAIKPRVFSPPFDVSAMEGLVANGPLRVDITKADGSIDWLRMNNSYYTYQGSRIVDVLTANLSGPAPTMRVTIEERSTLHTPRGSKNSQSLRPFTYTFAWEDGKWKIANYE